MMSMLICIVIGSQILGERLYSQVDKATDNDRKQKQEDNNIVQKSDAEEIKKNVEQEEGTEETSGTAKKDNENNKSPKSKFCI